MAETLVENQTCNACGAEVRPGAIFCYSCGETLQPKAVMQLKDKKNVSGAWFREGLTEEKNGNKSEQKESPVLKEVTEKPISKPSAETDTKLKSAAAMRRKSKVYQPKKVEIIWEEHENAPNVWFILVTIVLTLIAAGIFYLAIYLNY